MVVDGTILDVKEVVVAYGAFVKMENILNQEFNIELGPQLP